MADTSPSQSNNSGTGAQGSQVSSRLGNFRSYQYPQDVDAGSYLHSVNITILSSSGGGGGSKSGAKGFSGSTESSSGNSNASTNAEGGGVGQAIASTIGEAVSGISDGFSQGSTTPSAGITLIMTNAPENRMSAQWDATDFGLLGSALEQMRKDASLTDILQNVSKNVGTGSEYALRQMAAIFNIGKQLGINIPVSDGIQVFTRKVENPYKEQLFKTMNFRSFPMQFKFAPKNAGELANVMNILYELEYNMHPEKETVFLRYPSEFKIEYQYRGGKNPFLNEINTCVLTDMKVDYGHNGFMTSFEGGAPTEITVSLMFKETILRDRKQINPYATGGGGTTRDLNNQNTDQAINENNAGVSAEAAEASSADQNAQISDGGE